jgi:peroxidase
MVLDDNNYKLLPLNLGLQFSDDQLVRNLVFTGSANGTIKVRWRQMSA